MRVALRAKWQKPSNGGVKEFTLLYVVQDNEWDISAHASEIRKQDITEYAKGFKGLETRTIDGTDFMKSYQTVQECVYYS